MSSVSVLVGSSGESPCFFLDDAFEDGDGKKKSIK